MSIETEDTFTPHSSYVHLYAARTADVCDVCLSCVQMKAVAPAHVAAALIGAKGSRHLPAPAVARP